MTNLGKPSVIFLRLFRIQKRPAKSSHFGLSCDHCRKCHKRHVWLCLFILRSHHLSTSSLNATASPSLPQCILSSSTCATAAPSDVTIELHRLLKRITSSVEKSDALLYSYAPTPENPEKCKNMSLICYVCELKVIIFEEEIEEEKPEIYHLENILPLQLSSVNCPPCEAQTLVSATKFHQNFKDLLEKRNSQQKGR
uniref:Interleukin n=1 Tax=Gadus morhua TaxID=8049 RepID=A0A8C5FLY8_GADMO